MRNQIPEMFIVAHGVHFEQKIAYHNIKGYFCTLQWRN